MQVHILSFEGPDAYARAGSIASRVTGLAEALAAAGCDTHLWFIGDPELPGHENRGRLRLHRWCQWISRYHPAGVYDGEEGKQADYAASLPPFLFHQMLHSSLQQGERAVILAEEWQTVHAVLHLDWLLRTSGLRERCAILWNANNTFAFDRIDWARLTQAAVITTVSRYMKQLMWGLGVNSLVLPNGLPAEAFMLPAPDTMEAFQARIRGRTVLSKVARWDPDKRWLLAIETTRALQRQHWQPLLIARGGVEAHETEVLTAAAEMGLRVVERPLPQPGVPGLLHALEDLHEVDVLSLRSPLDGDSCRVLFRGSAAVLANSGREPFGLVGLETMAVGGIACTGATGEDYVVPGYNALILETTDPQEFVSLYGALHDDPDRERVMRCAGRATAQRYAWSQIVQEVLLPRLCMLVGVPNRRRRSGVPSGVRPVMASAHPVTSVPEQVLWRCGGDRAESLGYLRRQSRLTTTGP
jgi:glycosyltransferase involved in cell wall biosynthesis